MRRPSPLVAGVLVVVGGLGGGGLAGYAYYHGEVGAAHRAGQPATTIDIPPGTSVSGIGDILVRRGVIGSSLVFELYVRVHGLASKLQAGHYSVPGGASLADVVALLEHSRAHGVQVTIPEGLNSKQVAKILEAKGLFSAAEYEGAVAKGGFTEDFLTGRPPTASVEGYLFPDTYEFDSKATAADVINTQLHRFGEQVPASLRSGATGHKLTFDQALTLASIIEREARFPDDRPVISSVFYNRLEAGMPLQSDVTLLYAKGVVSGDLTEDDKKLDSPYNTYLHTGLPPGAICNPGLSSIKAALNPSTTDYIYFLADKDGHVHFSKTLAEHEALQVKYGVH